MRTRKLLFGLCLAAPVLLHAQVQIDRPIVLDGPTPASRQVTGLATDTLPGSVLTAVVEQVGGYRYAEPAGASIWQVTLPALQTAPIPGTHLLIKSPEPATGPVRMQVNGQGPYLLEWAPGDTVDAAELPAGSMLSLVFDGTTFQIVNGDVHGTRNCPGNLAPVSGQFCMERQQRAAAEFAVAVNNCAAVGRRLCTWGEFVAGCTRRTELSLNYTSNDWEWTNNSANEVNNVRMVKLTNCEQAGTRNMFTPAAPYRCCISR